MAILTYPCFGSVQDVLVAVQLGGGGGGAGVAAVPGLGEAEAADFLARGERRQELLLLLLASVLFYGSVEKLYKIQLTTCTG